MIDTGDDSDKSLNTPTRTYVRDAKAMAATPADVKEYPNSYAFIIDMPGAEVRRHQGSGGERQCAGDQRREEAGGGEGRRQVHGVLTVTVEKLPPPEPKKPRPLRRLCLGLILGQWLPRCRDEVGDFSRIV
ncbi:17.2 kDa class II heat shock protein [Vitis vinifera]|uniref:17.2 kDa class II heat shock protein n=1 Tax=Vitis vinifera TaxID=29760 RepID=A0A438K8G1_VITVI|nr:17.2 kDa class II heat shock protein [Vitis vinifera]